MLRVSTLYADTSVATAAYYTRYLTQADGEQPGHWTGRQAALLGLIGEVTTEEPASPARRPGPKQWDIVGVAVRESGDVVGSPGAGGGRLRCDVVGTEVVVGVVGAVGRRRPRRVS